METKSERFDRLDTMIREGRVIRKAWSEGQERACLLAALSPEAGQAQSALSCPADVIPPWLAYMTPSMDDNGTAEAWPAFVQRYATVVRRGAEALDTAGWRRAEYRVRALCVREAMAHTDNADVLAACQTVVSLCDRVVSGDEPTACEWEAATAAAAAWAAATAWAAAAARAAAAAAWDRISEGVLDAIEAEVQQSDV